MKTENKEITNFRVVRANGNTYVRVEDVMNFLIEIGSTEETDVRERMNKAAENLSSLKTKPAVG